jgi:hypothetical protein
MWMRAIVETSREPADFPIANQPRERHADTAGIAQIREIMGRESPTAPLPRNTGEDLTMERLAWRSAFHVENYVLFFQQVNPSSFNCIVFNLTVCPKLREQGGGCGIRRGKMMCLVWWAVKYAGDFLSIADGQMVAMPERVA